DIELPARVPAIDVGRQFPLLAAERAGIGRANARVELAVRVGRAAGIVGMTLVQAAAIRRIGEPDRAVGMRHDVVRRIERLAVVSIGDNGHRAVVFPAYDAPKKILARQLPALMIEGIAVGVVGRFAERRHPPVLPDIAVLRVAGDVAEDEVLSLARPSWPFGPIRAGPQPADWSTSQPDAVECRIDDDDVRVRVDRRPTWRPVARRAGDRAGRRAELRVRRGLRLGLRYRAARCYRGGHSGSAGE